MFYRETKDKMLIQFAYLSDYLMAFFAFLSFWTQSINLTIHLVFTILALINFIGKTATIV
jgi:hypothetical protein